MALSRTGASPSGSDSASCTLLLCSVPWLSWPRKPNHGACTRTLTWRLPTVQCWFAPLHSINYLLTLFFKLCEGSYFREGKAVSGRRRLWTWTSLNLHLNILWNRTMQVGNRSNNYRTKHFGFCTHPLELMIATKLVSTHDRHKTECELKSNIRLDVTQLFRAVCYWLSHSDAFKHCHHVFYVSLFFMYFLIHWLHTFCPPVLIMI